MSRCPSCGEGLESLSQAFCDQCGGRLSPSGPLMLGVSLGEIPRDDQPTVFEPPAEDAISPERFVPFASWRALRVPR